jgi:hypothetical protein
MKKKHFIFIIQNNNENRKHIKIKNKKIKVSKPGFKKPGDFTVTFGYPLVTEY